MNQIEAIKEGILKRARYRAIIVILSATCDSKEEYDNDPLLQEIVKHVEEGKDYQFLSDRLTFNEYLYKIVKAVDGLITWNEEHLVLKLNDFVDTFVKELNLVGIPMERRYTFSEFLEMKKFIKEYEDLI